MTATIGELCAGYGGLGMGVSAVLDAEVAWVADVCRFDKDGTVGHHDPHRSPCTILEHRFPGVPNLGDIGLLDWTTVPPVDVLSGGTPCQDVSHAGKRAGMTEGTRSNLWVAMREAIATLQPSLVIWENVGGAASAEADSNLEPCPRCVGDPRERGPVLRALGRVVGDLSSLGYVGCVRALRAAEVGSPHGRLRYFLAAHPAGDTRWLQHRDGGAARDTSSRRQRRSIRERRGIGQSPRPLGDADRGSLLPTPAAYDGDRGGPQNPDKRRDGGHAVTLQDAVHGLLPTPSAADGAGAGRLNSEGHQKTLPGTARDIALLPTPTASDYKGATVTRKQEGNDRGQLDAVLEGRAERLLPTPTSTDSKASGASYESTDTHQQGTTLTDAVVRQPDRWGEYEPVIRRWEALTRPAPEPTILSRKGTPQLSPVFSEWMMGLPAGWVTDTPGITRNEALRALGNGVVPQQAAAAIASLLDVLSDQAV